MFKNKYLGYIAAALLVLLGGCAVVDRGWRGDLSAAAPAVRESARSCAAHFDALDLAVERAGVGDAEAHRLPGFPYLRVDRFTASLRAAARAGRAAQAQWLARLQSLDQAARRVEIANLPAEAVRELQPANDGRAALLQATMRCANVLREQDVSTPARLELIYARAQVPDAYITWLRAAGLYSLTQWPFARGIAQWHDETQRAFQRDAQERSAALPVTRYVPAAAAAAVVAPAQIAALIRRASDNPLRVPQFSEAEQTLLLNTYAPVLDVERGGDYDRIGRLRLDADMLPAVDGAAPVLYHRIAFTRLGDQILTQLVYTAWFPARPLEHALDMLGGHLDGVVVRVTLSAGGEPLLYDSIHPCGCYHLFFPTSRVQPLPAPEDAGEWAFVPATLPAHDAGSRIVLRIATRTHYISGVSVSRDADGQHYGLLPEAGLRTLPLADDPRRTRSLYGPDGLVPGTARGERFFFWPMGIPSAGAMRQWGNHATAFVGRRHFDDADLIEKRFRRADH